jgi:hypothetical protein
MNPIFVQSVGLAGPGLNGWEVSRAVLASAVPYRCEPLPRLNPDILPANERRRSSEVVRLALTVAQEAMRASGLPLDAVATVFASSDGDGETLHHICEALAAPGCEVSPTRFHNSVHNAPAGYWSIATGCKLPSNSLCGYDVSFAAGLLDAATQVVVERRPVLLVAFDAPFPPPLDKVRGVEHAFAVALLLVPEATAQTLARWEISLGPDSRSTELPRPFSALHGNPAARALPLLHGLASRKEGTVRLAYSSDGDVIIYSRP